MIHVKSPFRVMMAALGLGVVFALTSPAAEESLDEWYTAAGLAYSSGDPVTAEYYYQRILQSPDWGSYDKQINVLRSLGMVEESQARFQEAAQYYKQLMDLLTDRSDANVEQTYRLYVMRYANCLERSGRYVAANEIYWNVYRESEPAIQVDVLKQILQNSGFIKLTPAELDVLRKEVVPRHQDELGWDLAELLRLQGRLPESQALYEELWRANPDFAREYVPRMTELYTALGKLDALIEGVRAERVAGQTADTYLLLEVAILKEAQRDSEALAEIEKFALRGKDFQDLNPEDYEQLLSEVSAPLLNEWIELVIEQRGAAPGIELLRAFLTIMPLDTQRRQRLSDLYVSAGKVDEAVRLWADWSEVQAGKPFAVLSAVEEIYALGETQNARDLLKRLGDQIPPAFALKRGQTALQFGDYPEALAAFQVAAASGGIPPAMITSTIQSYTETAAARDALAAALVDSVSGQPYTAVPEWIKTSLVKFGVQTEAKEHLKRLVAGDPSGVWNFYIANEAARQGDRKWAVELLEAVPQDSLYHPMAGQALASLLQEDPSIDAQRRAARLLKPSLANLLSATPGIPLTPSMAGTLLDYAEICLNAYEPGEALAAIRTVESASGALTRPLDADAVDRLTFTRAKFLAEMASFGPAVERLQTITGPAYGEEARFWLARIHIAQRNVEAAQTELNALVEDPAGWRRANDALSLLLILDALAGDSLDLFCDSVLYQLQGRFEDAIPPLRQLAVNQYGEDMEEWARYHIGKLKWEAGDRTGAREEWERLLLDVDQPVIHGLTRWELVHLDEPGVAPESVQAQREDLIMKMPDTLFADLARLETQQRARREQP
ncbi:MAG: hypothetical protein ACE15F_14770 [bacterium]